MNLLFLILSAFLPAHAEIFFGHVSEGLLPIKSLAVHYIADKEGQIDHDLQEQIRESLASPVKVVVDPQNGDVGECYAEVSGELRESLKALADSEDALEIHSAVLCQQMAVIEEK